MNSFPVVLTSCLVIFASSFQAEAREEKFDCTVQTSEGVQVDYQLVRDRRAAISGAAAISEFMKKDIHVSTDAYCGNARRAEDASLPLGTTKWKGELSNTNGNCELEIDARGEGIYRETRFPPALRGKARVTTSKVSCRDWR